MAQDTEECPEGKLLRELLRSLAQGRLLTLLSPRKIGPRRTLSAPLVEPKHSCSHWVYHWQAVPIMCMHAQRWEC